MRARRTTDRRARRREGILRRWMLRAVLVATALATAGAVRAEPYLAMNQGATCGACHVNRTGGGMRNPFGASFGRMMLPWSERTDLAVWDGNLHPKLRVGADLRGRFQGRFPEPGPFIGEFAVREANLYLAADVLQDRLALYVDQRVAPGGSLNREAFLMIRSRRWASYVKAGKFFPPYGTRFLDDALPIRRDTGFTFAASDTGVEFGAEPGNATLAVAVTNGTGGGAETDNGKQVSARGAYVRKQWRLGASLSNNDLPGAARRSLAGAHGGVRAGPVVFLGEWDVIRDTDVSGGSIYGRAAHLEADWFPQRGLTFRVWWGRSDPDRDAPGDLRRQVGAGADWTPWPGLQVRVFGRLRSGPSSVPGGSDDEVVAELHLYF